MSRLIIACVLMAYSLAAFGGYTDYAKFKLCKEAGKSQIKAFTDIKGIKTRVIIDTDNLWIGLAVNVRGVWVGTYARREFYIICSYLTDVEIDYSGNS